MADLFDRLDRLDDGEEKYLPEVGYLYNREDGLAELPKGTILKLNMPPKPSILGNLRQSIFQQTLDVQTIKPRQRKAEPEKGITKISKAGFQDLPTNDRRNEVFVEDNNFTLAKLQEVSGAMSSERADEILMALRSGLSDDHNSKLKNPFRPGDNLATAELLVLAADYRKSHYKVPQAGENEKWKPTSHVNHDIHHHLVEHGHVPDENDLVSLEDGVYRKKIQKAVKALVNPKVDQVALAAAALDEEHQFRNAHHHRRFSDNHSSQV